MNDAASPPRGVIKSFVLRSGRMSRAQSRSYAALKSRFVIPFDGGIRDFSEDFGNARPLTVEIGFGMGEAAAEIAARNSDHNYLGIEVFRAGVGKLLWEIEKRNLSNIRIIEYDAAGVVERMIAPESIIAFHIFFPDPWPKTKHHKRRLVRRPFTETLASRLKPGGYVYMATDWEDYARFALAELSATPGLENRCGEGFAPRQEWRPATRFEQKGLRKNHAVWELYFIRKAGKTGKIEQL